VIEAFISGGRDEYSVISGDCFLKQVTASGATYDEHGASCTICISIVLDVKKMLAEGKSLGLPISRPLPSIAKGLHELRLSSRSGEFRVFYFIKVGDAIYVVHACCKKKQAIDKRTTDLLKNRIRSISL